MDRAANAVARAGVHGEAPCHVAENPAVAVVGSSSDLQKDSVVQAHAVLQARAVIQARAVLQERVVASPKMGAEHVVVEAHARNVHDASSIRYFSSIVQYFEESLISHRVEW